MIMFEGLPEIESNFIKIVFDQSMHCAQTKNTYKRNKIVSMCLQFKKTT